MAASQKKLTLFILYSRKAILLLKLLYTIGAIQNYHLLIHTNIKTKQQIKIYVNYYKKQPLTKYFKLISRPSRTFHISYLALRMLQKRTYSSVYFLSTNIGLITHHDAIRLRIGGILIGFVFN
jgi:ribosomal protein S8